MDDSDPYRSTNPWSLARYLRHSCRRCPVCGRDCDISAVFDPNEEMIRMEASCPGCGKNTLIPSVKENGDILIETSDGKVYEPDRECSELLERIGGRDIGDSDTDTLKLFSGVAARYAETRRPSAAVELGKRIASAYRSAGRIHECLAQASATASVLVDSNQNMKALELYGEYLPLTEISESGVSFSFILAHAFSQFVDGDIKSATSAVRKVIQALDRLKSENRLPADDPFIRSRAYEALGLLLSSSNDKTGAMKALKKSVEDSREVLGREVTEEGLMWMSRCSREYAFACHQADMGKRSMEALKNSIKMCSASREKFPKAYAESLLERAMFICDSGIAVPSYLRQDLDEAISVFEKISPGKCDPLLPIAYYYRSLTGADKEKLDTDDLSRAYELIRDGAVSGHVPDSVLTSVVDTYVTYLDANDETKAEEVRKELAEMGIHVRPMMKKKPQ